MDRSLRPGQTGCLRGGRYGDIHTRYSLKRSGTASGRITIRSYPGEVATVTGWIVLESSYTTLSHLRIDGSNTFFRSRPASQPSCSRVASMGLVIAGHDDIFEYNDYYQSVARLRSNGIGVGWWGNSNNTVVRFNKIHDVGGCDSYDHLVYLGSGADVQIYRNWLWNDRHGWGVKLDPGPANAKIWRNVIDAAGSGFNFGNSSGHGQTSGSQVFDNIVSNSVGIRNPDIHWTHPGVLVTSPGLLSASTGNRVFGNVSANNRGGITNVAGSVRPQQLWISGNRVARLRFVDAAHHTYRLRLQIRSSNR